MKHNLFIAAALLSALILLFSAPAFAEDAFVPYTADELFTERDLEQEADLFPAEEITVTSGKDVRSTKEGVYVLSGAASGSTVYVEADPQDKVQLVLKGLSLANEGFPCIYILTADKVFITVAEDSSLTVTGEFRKDGDTKTDGTVFSVQDLVLNGTAALSVSSSANGIVCKDDLKITGGTYHIQAEKKAIEANDSIRVTGGTFNLVAGTDGLHAESKKDASLGYICIFGGTFAIAAGDEGIQASSVLQIDGGSFDIASSDGMAAPKIVFAGGGPK